MSMRQMLATSNGGQACELGVEKNIRKLWTLEPNSQVMSLKFVFFKAHDPITFSSRFGTLLPNQIQLTTYRQIQQDANTVSPRPQGDPPATLLSNFADSKLLWSRALAPLLVTAKISRNEPILLGRLQTPFARLPQNPGRIDPVATDDHRWVSLRLDKSGSNFWAL